MKLKADLVFDSKATLGEGPVWDYKKQLLFWVDIEGCALHAHKPSNNENKNWLFDDMIGAAVPTTSGKMILALAPGLASFDLENETMLQLNVLKNKDALMRYNDGKVDLNGNFWIGSMHKEIAAESGNLYQVRPDFKTVIKIPKTTISNGMVWTSDQKKFYFIDSPAYQITAYDFDAITGEITNKKTAFEVPKNYGAPDGMCIDSEDMLWVAHWGGSCIRRWNPKTGTVLAQIDVPAPHVTSCCFGDEHLKTLYITTARSGLDKKQLAEFPQSGGLFKCQPGVTGKRINYFKEE